MVDTSKPSYNVEFDPINNPHGIINVGNANGLGIDEVLQIGKRIGQIRRSDVWAVPAAVSAL
jgi:hypothetical protein